MVSRSAWLGASWVCADCFLSSHSSMASSSTSEALIWKRRGQFDPGCAGEIKERTQLRGYDSLVSLLSSQSTRYSTFPLTDLSFTICLMVHHPPSWDVGCLLGLRFSVRRRRRRGMDSDLEM